MSININVAIPLETLVAIRNVTDVDVSADIKAETSKAVIDAVRALPYDIAPRPVRTPTSSSVSTSDAHPPKKRIKTEQTGSINVTIMSHRGHSISIKIESDALVEKVKENIEDVEGLPRDVQRLIYAGKQLEDGRRLDWYCIGDGATLHQVLRLRGS